ncbi:MAG: type II toxin-antitoxin system RelE/ParE family toxin [Deltaproteobacteria bacterium]|nr:type II toxin-antitoxin system RelE/ParE family toxin [Deltaproteobacteria bacterium]
MARKQIVRWAPLAAADLEQTHAYLHERNPAAAQRFAQRIIEAVERLRAHPEMGPIATDLLPKNRYRHWICGHHRIIYRVEGLILWILRVWDARQSPRRLRVER